MAKQHYVLTVTERASAAVAPYRIVKPAATEGQYGQSAAAADKLYGVSTAEGADAALDPLDIAVVGIAPVQYGAAVTQGDPLTSDANGRAIVGLTGNNIIGHAAESGALDEIGSVRIAPGKLP